MKRLLAVDRKLADIPQLTEEKKWSQVQGILTDPLGSLGETPNLISKEDRKPEGHLVEYIAHGRQSILQFKKKGSMRILSNKEIHRKENSNFAHL